MGRLKVSVPAAPLFDLGAAGWALEDESGDAYTAAPFPGGMLLGVIDGLGHGPEAAKAARIAAATLAARPAASVRELAGLCHEALRGTRGAVASLASVRAGATFTWLGVGNVEAVLVPRHAERPNQLLGSRGGVLGHEMPPLHAATVAIEPGDALAFATDGVDSSTLTRIDPVAPAQTSAERILAEGCKRTDDALVLVARYRGSAS